MFGKKSGWKKRFVYFIKTCFFLLSSGIRQPDNREEREGGETESCVAVLNNFYGDGIKWHDVACTHEKPIICEDVEGHLQFARQTFPQINIP